MNKALLIRINFNHLKLIKWDFSMIRKILLNLNQILTFWKLDQLMIKLDKQ